MGDTGESMHSWPFSLKENGAAINPPLHSNREIALASSQVPGPIFSKLSQTLDRRDTIKSEAK
jgi:hypothetical protein